MIGSTHGRLPSRPRRIIKAATTHVKGIKTRSGRNAEPVSDDDDVASSSGSEDDREAQPITRGQSHRGGGRTAAPPKRALTTTRRSRAAAAAAGGGGVSVAVKEPPVVKAPLVQEVELDGSSSEEEEEEKEAASKGSKAKAMPSRKRSVLELLSGKLDEATLKRLAREQPENKNFNLKAKLSLDLEAKGPLWRFQIRSGYNLLLYGFGSKRTLVDRFAREVLTDGALVSVNGFNPLVNAKQVALGVASAIVPGNHRGVGAAALIEMIRNQPEDAGRHVYIIIHNIDGPGLRGTEEQALLAELAGCPGVHIVATVDHINAPLLWDVKTRAALNWLCHDATTFAPYFAETLDMPPVLMARTQETSRRGASTALGSMAPTAQAVFRLIAETQLDDPASPGMTFPALFRMCRERWLVSSEQALRSFLTEFFDHELVAERTASLDGGDQREVLYAPHEEGVLRQILEQMDQQQNQ